MPDTVLAPGIHWRIKQSPTLETLMRNSLIALNIELNEKCYLIFYMNMEIFSEHYYLELV